VALNLDELDSLLALLQKRNVDVRCDLSALLAGGIVPAVAPAPAPETPKPRAEDTCACGHNLWTEHMAGGCVAEGASCSAALCDSTLNKPAREEAH